jgi:hypothetical protein
MSRRTADPGVGRAADSERDQGKRGEASSEHRGLG